MNKFFQVSFVWVDTVKSAEQLKPIFDLAEDWMVYGGIWIIYTSEDISTWGGRLRAVLGLHDMLLICEINNIAGSDGWMPPWVWEWINRPRVTQPQFNFFIPPPLPSPFK